MNLYNNFELVLFMGAWFTMREENQIDIVYLWCNNKYSTDNDELKYSLRSIELNAPWINKVHIIVDHDIPSWLKTKHNKLDIITHDQIMPRNTLPTYNSNAIEHCILNIPNLSELFLLSNDDTFIYKKIKANFFFSKNNLPIYYFGLKNFFETWYGDYEKTLYNTSKLFYNKYKYTFTYLPSHNIEAYKKSIVKECKDNFHNEIETTIYNNKRKCTDVQRYIYSLFAIYKHFCKIKFNTKEEYLLSKIFKNNCTEYFADNIINNLPIKNELKIYILKLLERKWYWSRFSKNFKTCNSLYLSNSWLNSDMTLKYLRLRNPYLFCLNDDTRNATNKKDFVYNVLNPIFPNKSSFEL